MASIKDLVFYFVFFFVAYVATRAVLKSQILAGIPIIGGYLTMGKAANTATTNKAISGSSEIAAPEGFSGNWYGK